jgi:hypothetical protein
MLFWSFCLLTFFQLLGFFGTGSVGLRGRLDLEHRELLGTVPGAKNDETRARKAKGFMSLRS